MWIAEMNMIGVRPKRGCFPHHLLSAYLSISGMATSGRTTPTSFLNRISSASLADLALIRFSPSSARIASVREEFPATAIHHQGVDSIGMDHRGWNSVGRWKPRSLGYSWRKHI